MALNITQEQYEVLLNYASNGDYHSGWSYLALIGDKYADNASAVTSGNATGVDAGFEYLVKNHWENTAGPGAYEQHFESVARQHFRKYVDSIDKINNYLLPNSKQIEKSYYDAVVEHGLPVQTAIDGVITSSFGKIMDVLAGPLWDRHETLDWTDGLRMEDERQVESDVFDELTIIESGLILLEDVFDTINDLNDADIFTDVIIDAWHTLGDIFSETFIEAALGFGDFINDIEESVNDFFNMALDWIWPRDPIILDLDGDGFETVGFDANVYFDHDGDGVLTKTGWAGADDGLLVWDRNTNGTIDTGAELFGDFTEMPDGTLAPNGFAALAALDENGDGVIDANDPAFSELKVWRDSSQDGETDEGELISLAEAGIVSLSLSSTLKNQPLDNGNTLSRVGSFTRTDGTEGGMGEFNLVINTSDTQFVDVGEVPDSIKSLPNMGGAGNVRNLQEAATLSSSLEAILSQFQSTTTRAGQQALVDELLAVWADTSGMGKTLEDRADGQYRIQYASFGDVYRSQHMNLGSYTFSLSGSSVADSASLLTDAGAPYLSEYYRNLIDEWSRKLHVLEAFNGQYFFNLPNETNQTVGARWGVSGGTSTSGGAINIGPPALYIQFSRDQLYNLQQAYDSLRESVYSSLVMQTRLKPYLDAIELTFGESGLQLDATAVTQMLADKLTIDPENYLADLLELNHYAGDFLNGTNWDAFINFDQVMETIPNTPAITDLLNDFNVRTLGGGDNRASLTHDADIALGGDGNDTLYGALGNDHLFGQAGDDLLQGSFGNDLLSGGTGDDILNGQAGADTYVFARGFGHDTIIDYIENGVRRDRVRLVGLTPSDIQVTTDYADNLTFTIVDTGDTLTVPKKGNWWNLNGVGQYVFDDGTVWSHDDALRAAVADATENDDVIHGSSADDTITGQAGNDTLIGNAGDDVIDGGTGDDLLIGATGLNRYYENGQWHIERNTIPETSANGNDTYLFGRGDGADIVIDGDSTAGNTDTLRFKEGVAPSDVRIIRDGNDLILSIRDSSDQVTLRRYFENVRSGADGEYLIEQIAFADGTVLSFDDVQATLFAGSEEAETIIGSKGDDILTGLGGDDVLLGGAGHDILDGGAGNDVLIGWGTSQWNRQDYDREGDGDTYLFGRGDGHDTIFENSWQQGEVDRIVLKAGLTADDVRLERVRTVDNSYFNDSLKITIRETGETLTVKNHFNESQRYAIEEIAFADGTVWDSETIKSRSLLGEASDDELRGFYGRDDVIAGGAGNDILMGGTGSDTYRFGMGDGHDVIVEGRDDSQDIVELAPGITQDDVTVRWTVNGDMAVILSDGSKLTVRNQAEYWSNEIGVEQLRFDDGTIWDRTELASRALEATDGNDAIVGGYQDDMLDGGVGNDSFQDLGGYDTYHFGTGDGHDVIEDNNGRVVFKSGVDQNDVTFSREGNDLIATLNTSGDTLRIKAWLSDWNRINRFDFANGAQLSKDDVAAILNVSEGSEILYGSPGNDVIAGTEKDSTIYGREGNDQLIGNAGRDVLYGEAGDDTLDGGSERDRLRGGEGHNTYVMSQGMGLDNAYASSLSVADDTVLFAPGITLEDVSVQLGSKSWDTAIGAVGYANMVVGIGGNDALILQNETWSDLGRGAVQRFRFDDGTEVSLADMVVRADDGEMGWQQRYDGGPATLVGSQADDDIYDYTGEAITVQARGNDDTVHLQGGDDVVSAGSGDDSVYAGGGDDLIAAETGNDRIESDDGDDVIVFNAGDGNDIVTVGSGQDTLSFGGGITPERLSMAIQHDGYALLLVDGGTGGTIALQDVYIDDLPGAQALERLQFIDAEGQVRIFDLAGWLQNNKAALLGSTPDAPVTFDGSGFELTGLALPAGGLEAVAYAQSGDLFATPNLTTNTPTDGDDVLYGTSAADTLNAGAGNDVALGLAGNDQITGGEGNDVIDGGAGDDVLDGGAGNDVLRGGWGADQLSGGTGNDELYGEWGGDTYLYQPGEGQVIIDDDHRVLRWDTGPNSGGEEEYVPSEEYFYEGEGEPGAEPGDTSAVIDDAPNVLAFGPGIRAEDLRYSEQDGDLVIEFVNQPGDKVILRGFDPNRATQTRSVDIIRFSDGTEIVADSIEPTGKTVVSGDEDGDWLDGTSFADTLIGGSGDDFLNGQGGSDHLLGGTGSDTYRIHKEWNTPPTQTIITEEWREQDTNRIELTGNYDPDYVHLEFDGRDLLLRLTEDGDVIRFAGFDPRAVGMQAPVAEVSFPWWGESISFDELLDFGVRIIGTPGDDVLTGTDFSDWFEGLESNDTMSGGAGGDTYVIAGDGGSDTIVDSEEGGAPNVLVLPVGTTLDDVSLSYDSEGFLILDLKSTGNRIRLSGFSSENPLGARAVERFRFGLNGEEIGYEELLAIGFDIVGTEESDALTGTILTDRVWGGDGNDLLNATPGGDWLAGEGGNDIYVVNLGDGTVTIDDVAAEGVGNLLRFGAGIEADSLRNNLRFEDDGNGGYVLLIPYGEEGDVVRLTGFDPNDVLGTHAIDQFEFDDGTTVDYATLVTWTFVVEGDNTGNALTGTNVGDRLYGYEGDDVMEAGDGEDVLTGGTGNDVMRGGTGRDAYVVNLGDGADVIEDAVEAGIGNILTFGEGISREDVRLEVDGADMLVHYGSGTDVVRVQNYDHADGTVIDTFEFADGSTLTLREFMNQAPEVTSAIDDQVVLEDAAFTLVLPDDLIIDPEGGDILTRVAVSGYESLPQWLLYDAATRTLYGTPENDDVGEFDVIVQGMDELGEVAFQGFHVTVQNTNDAPVIGMILDGQTAWRGDSYSWQLPQAAFVDVDIDDQLTYSARLADGSALPEWLDFDPATGTFNGTPAIAGNYDVEVTATDLAGAQVSQTFSLEVISLNEPPTAVTDNISALEDGGPVIVDTDTLLANDTDPNAEDTLSVLSVGESAVGASVTLENEQVIYDIGEAYQSLAQGEVLEDTFSYTISDNDGETDTGTVEVSIVGTNDLPVTTDDTNSVTEDQNALAEGNVLANDHDVDTSDVLRIANHGEHVGTYGTLLLSEDGSYTYSLNSESPEVQSLGRNVQEMEQFELLVTDGHVEVASSLQITVNGSNDAPVVANALEDQDFTFHKPFSWQIPEGSFQDTDEGDVIDYTATLADGSALPSWLKFDPQTQTFSGCTPKKVGYVDVRVTVTDRDGETGSTEGSLSTSDVFRLSISHGNQGVGNGHDAAPAGHHHNFNDGPGSYPGNPGARHKKHRNKHGDKGYSTHEGHNGNDGHYAKTPKFASPEKLKSGRYHRHHGVQTLDTNALLAHWEAIDRYIADHAKGKRGSHEADGGAMTTNAMNGLLGSHQRWSSHDPVSIKEEGNRMRRFKGLHEGLESLG